MGSARLAYLAKQEADKVILRLFNNLPNPKHREACVISVARRLLLNNPYWYQGHQYTLMAKSIGAGVYEVWLVESA